MRMEGEAHPWLQYVDLLLVIFVLLPSGIVFKEIVRHRNESTTQQLRRSYVQMLCVPPLGAVLAWLGIVAPKGHRTYEVGVCLGEAVCFVAFFHMLVTYCGGVSKYSTALQARKANTTIICGRFCSASSHEIQVLSWQRMVYQVVAMPLWPTSTALLCHYTMLCESIKWPMHVLQILQTVTCVVALLSMYFCSRHYEFANLAIGQKLVTLKAFLILPKISAFVIVFLARHAWIHGTADEKIHTAARIRGYVLLCYANFFSVMFVNTFSAHDYALETAAPDAEYYKLPESMSDAESTFSKTEKHAENALEDEEDDDILEADGLEYGL